LLVVVTAAVSMVHAVVTPAADAPAHASVTGFTAVALDAPACHGFGLPQGGHESCGDPTAERCAAIRSSAHVAAVGPDDVLARAGATRVYRLPLPRSVERAVDRAHLQVWLR
jgi:hypothetical protein